MKYEIKHKGKDITKIKTKLGDFQIIHLENIFAEPIGLNEPILTSINATYHLFEDKTKATMEIELDPNEVEILKMYNNQPSYNPYNKELESENK